MNTTTLNTYAGSYRIYTIIVALNSNLSTIARDTGNTLDCDRLRLNRWWM